MNRLPALILLLGCLTCAQTPAPAGKASALPERSIYIPYERLWQVFEKDGRGVFLPYEEYEKLRKAAEQRAEQPTKEPVASLVAEVTGTVTVEGTVANVVASLRLQVLAKGWQRVPLGLRDVAITKATMGSASPRLLYDAKEGYVLLVDNTDGKAQELVLELAFAKACVKSPGRNAVSFQPPPAPVGHWQVRIPEPGVKVDVKPVVAATEAAADKAGGTVVQAFVGATPQIQIAWTPKAEGARGLQAIVSVASEVGVQLGEGITRVRALVASTVTRAEIPGQTLVVPASYRVVNVFDENVRAWSVKKADDTQEISVEFFKPIRGKQTLLVELERLANEPTVAVPSIAVRGASREQGLVLVGVAEGLRAEVVDRDRLVQDDLAELLKEAVLNKAGNWQFGYRFASVPYELTCRVAKIKPRVLAKSLAEVQLTPERMQLDFTSVLDVQRTGLFRVDLLVPSGFAVAEVSGVEQSGLQTAAIDGFHLGKAQDGMVPLSVNLRSRAFGRTGVRVRLTRKLDEPSLLRPAETPAAFSLVVPRLAPDLAERETGGLVLYAPSSLRVTPVEAPDLRPVAHQAAISGVPSVKPAGLVPTLSYLYADQGGTLKVEARRRPPYVLVRQVLWALFDSASIRYNLNLLVDVNYSGIERLRIDLPADLPQVRSLSQNVRLTPHRGEAPTDLAEGYRAWILEPETEFIGNQRVRLTWEAPMESLEVGKSVTVSLPRPIVQGADRTFGQIVLAKAQGIDVQPEDAKGLRFIDPRHDMFPGVSASGGTAACEFYGEWSLRAKASRYEPQEVKVTSIERGLVRMVLTRSGVTSVQALYKLSTMRQRLVVVLPEETAFDTHPLHLNGRATTLEQGTGGEYLVPLQGLPQGTPLLMELRYTVPRSGTLVPPSFPEEPAMQKVYLSVHAPREMSYLGYRGDWHPEFVWALESGFGVHPRAKQPDDNLIFWVCDGLKVDQGPLMDFATDGSHILFSTLRPAAGEKGALRLSLLRSWQARGLLVLVILVVGGLLLRSSITAKIAGGVGVLVGWILLLMVLPSFAKSLLSSAAVGAALVVGAVWFLWCLIVLRPRLRFVSLSGDDSPEADVESEQEPAEAETAEKEVAERAGDASAASEPPRADTDETKNDAGGPNHE
jgi:hypothetical protein